MRLYDYQSAKLTELILDFVAEEVGPEELYTRDDLVAYVKVNLNPEDVFSEDELAGWAFDNGYRRFE